MKPYPILELKCNSVLAPYMKDFVEQKRALGLRFNAQVEVFREFDRFCVKKKLNEPILTEDIMNEWCQRRQHESIVTHGMRVSYVRQLSHFLVANGLNVPAVFHPVSGKNLNFIPYIFTHDEMARLLHAVDEIAVYSPISPARHLIMPRLFRTLYACGLRISEALTMLTEDVDITKGTMLIREAKGGFDRLVVLPQGLKADFAQYIQMPEVKPLMGTYFFPAPSKGVYDTSHIYAYFRKSLRLAGIPHRGRGKGPRLHDIRHTFAVHVLNRWAAQGKDLYACIPVLSAYLGHHTLASTENYLRLVPEAYGQITDTFDEKFPNMFAEAKYETD